MFGLSGLNRDDVLKECSDYFARTVKAWNTEVAASKKSFDAFAELLSSKFNTLSDTIISAQKRLNNLHAEQVSRIDATVQSINNWQKELDSKYEALAETARHRQDDFYKNLSDYRAKVYALNVEESLKTQEHRLQLQELLDMQNDLLGDIVDSINRLEKPAKKQITKSKIKK